ATSPPESFAGLRLIASQLERPGYDNLGWFPRGLVQHWGRIRSHKSGQALRFPYRLPRPAVEGRKVGLFRRIDQHRQATLNVDRRRGQSLNSAKRTERRAPEFLAVRVEREEANVGEKHKDRAPVGSGSRCGKAVQRVRKLGTRFADGAAPEKRSNGRVVAQ